MGLDEYGKNIDLYKEVHKFLEMKYTGASIAELQVQFMHIKKLASENSLDLNRYLKYIDFTHFRNGKSVSNEVNKILASASNPLTYELCEAMLEYFLNSKNEESVDEKYTFESREVYLKSDHHRKYVPGYVENDAKNKKRIEFENKAMIEGVKLSLERGTIGDKFLDAAEKFLRERYGDKESKLQFSYSNKKNVIMAQLNIFLNGGIVDKNFSSLFKYMKRGSYDFTEEHCRNENYSIVDDSSYRVKIGSTFRIYLNNPVDDKYDEFIYRYVHECQLHNLCYDMKAFYPSEGKDRTVFYFYYYEFPKHIEILENLFKEYSKDGVLGGELGLGSPPSATAQIPTLPNVGICFNPTNLESSAFIGNPTFTSYFNGLCLRVLYSMFNGSNYEKNRFHYFVLNMEEREKLHEKLSVLWNDPLKRKVIINTFMKCIQDEHDNIVGKKNSNIAVDFYTTAFTDSNVNKLDDDYKVSSGLKK